MTYQAKELVLLSLLNISVVGSKVSSSLKTTIHEAFSFRYHINKIHTQRTNQLAVTAKILSQSGIELCVASVAVQSWQTAFHGLHERLPCLFNIHVSSEHRSYLWLARDRIIFQLHYGTVNRSPSQSLATGGIAVCLHAVQQCGCNIIQREWKKCFWWLYYTGW